MHFLIQKDDTTAIPAQEFGYTTIQAVQERKWLHPDSKLSFSMQAHTDFSEYQLRPNVVPVGSVEFCMERYSRMGVGSIRPLNTPKCLWPMVKRTIFEGAGPPAGKERRPTYLRWFRKSNYGKDAWRRGCSLRVPQRRYYVRFR